MVNPYFSNQIAELNNQQKLEERAKILAMAGIPVQSYNDFYKAYPPVDGGFKRHLKASGCILGGTAIGAAAILGLASASAMASLPRSPTIYIGTVAAVIPFYKGVELGRSYLFTPVKDVQKAYSNYLDQAEKSINAPSLTQPSLPIYNAPLISPTNGLPAKPVKSMSTSI